MVWIKRATSFQCVSTLLNTSQFVIINSKGRTKYIRIVRIYSVYQCSIEIIPLCMCKFYNYQYIHIRPTYQIFVRMNRRNSKNKQNQI